MANETVEIDGVLKSATRNTDAWGRPGLSITGAIYGDKKGRFRDGDVVTTSSVTKELPGDIFVTRNSVYRVESWMQEPS